MPDSLRVLVVEDEALVALEIEAMLTIAGHEVVGLADTCSEAIAIAAERRPMLALVDMQLAEGDSGLAVAAALRDLGIPALFATGNCPAEAGSGLAIGCLHKPFDDRTLAGAVEAASAIIAGREPERIPRAMHLYGPHHAGKRTDGPH